MKQIVKQKQFQVYAYTLTYLSLTYLIALSLNKSNSFIGVAKTFQ